MKRTLILFAILLSAAGLMAQSPKIFNLAVTGSNIKWYDSPKGGTHYASPATTNLESGQISYASQAVNVVESTARFNVLVTMTNP